MAAHWEVHFIGAGRSSEKSNENILHLRAGDVQIETQPAAAVIENLLLCCTFELKFL